MPDLTDTDTHTQLRNPRYSYAPMVNNVQLSHFIEEFTGLEFIKIKINRNSLEYKDVSKAIMCYLVQTQEVVGE